MPLPSPAAACLPCHLPPPSSLSAAPGAGATRARRSGCPSPSWAAWCSRREAARLPRGEPGPCPLASRPCLPPLPLPPAISPHLVSAGQGAQPGAGVPLLPARQGVPGGWYHAVPLHCLHRGTASASGAAAAAAAPACRCRAQRSAASGAQPAPARLALLQRLSAAPVGLPLSYPRPALLPQIIDHFLGPALKDEASTHLLAWGAAWGGTASRNLLGLVPLLAGRGVQPDQPIGGPQRAAAACGTAPAHVARLPPSLPASLPSCQVMKIMPVG